MEFLDLLSQGMDGPFQPDGGIEAAVPWLRIPTPDAIGEHVRKGKLNRPQENGESASDFADRLFVHDMQKDRGTFWFANFYSQTRNERRCTKCLKVHNINISPVHNVTIEEGHDKEKVKMTDLLHMPTESHILCCGQETVNTTSFERLPKVSIEECT